MAAAGKSLFIAQQSLTRFFARRDVVYYWTLTFAENLLDKAEAERRWKPIVDLIKRRGGEHLEFWELQERGAWHVHFVTDIYIDVVWFREWTVKRGWGPIMKVKAVRSPRRWNPDKHTWERDDRLEAGLIRYLLKYLTKCFRQTIAFKTKAFGGTVRSKVGNTHFKWVPEVHPGAYLYFHGRQLYQTLFGHGPTFEDLNFVIRLGYEATDWGSVDFLYEPP